MVNVIVDKDLKLKLIKNIAFITIDRKAFELGADMGTKPQLTKPKPKPKPWQC